MVQPEKINPDATRIADERFRDREPSFGGIPPGAVRLGVCGDDRPMSPVSRERLTDHYRLDPALRYNRDFGGIHGDAHDVAVVMAALGSTNLFTHHANDFNAFTAVIKETFAEDARLGQQEDTGGIIPIDHSDEHKEGNAKGLNMDANEGLGCKFDDVFGTLMYLESTNPDLQQEAREEYMRTVDSDPEIFEKVLKGVHNAFDILLKQNPDYSVTREDVAALADQAPNGQRLVAILEGDHFDVKDVVEIANYERNSSAEPDKNHPAFVTDMTDKTFFTCRAFQRKGIVLDPQYLFAAKILKRAAVRFALAGQQANRMAHTERGNAQQALANIRQELALAA